MIPGQAVQLLRAPLSQLHLESHAYTSLLHGFSTYQKEALEGAISHGLESVPFSWPETCYNVLFIFPAGFMAHSGLLETITTVVNNVRSIICNMWPCQTES